MFRLARRVVPGLAVTAVVCGVVWGAWRAADTVIVLLESEGGASWIAHDRPFAVKAHSKGEGRTEFRHRFELEDRAKPAGLLVRALGEARVSLDGVVLGSTRPGRHDVIQEGHLPWPQPSDPGPHEIVVAVENPRGPAVVLILGDGIDLKSGARWEARVTDGAWSPVALAGESVRPAITERFPSVPEAVRARMPWLAGLFLVAFAVSLAAQRGAARFLRTAWVWRLGLLLAWSVLLVNNWATLPLGLGFDASDHLDYVRWIANHATLPHPLEGWQMFQGPLFYLVAAPIHALFGRVASPEGADRLLRVIPLVCGLLQVELGFRAARWAFPGRDDLHVVAAIVAGFLPMNLVMAQYVGNEPFAALWSGLAIVAAVRLIQEPERARRAGPMIALGALAGAAVLSKVSALLLVAPLLVVAALSARRLAAPAIVLGSIAAVSGWFFARNAIVAGAPFVISSASETWWQDPGYRVAGHYARFGAALVHPVFAAATSVWDGLWASLWFDGQLSSVVFFEQRPPWNYDFALAGTWLGLIPAVAMIVGALRGLGRRVVVFALGTVLLYLAGILVNTILVPFYSTAKASYMLGVLPLLGVLAAAGVAQVPPKAWARALVHAALACWAVWSWVGYLVRDAVLPLSLP